ncbi:glycosyltransferase family 1 protein [Rhodoferax sp.]|uniref:glycosyltransferase family protein n=1 Tax=Rhodoferax sp. TaxID=50421 RepID=UPI00374CCDB5
MIEKLFELPVDSIGRFAIVKLWPDIKTAEDECIARLKMAASALNIECIEIHADGSFLSDPKVKVSKSNVDFVIHLHYDTPKRYDAFSFVALWNPLKFYHEWGYARTSRNLTSHDDFISCSSQAADDHVARMIRTSATHLPANFHLYHSTPDVIHPPSIGEGKLFYAGINWEAINGGKSRHQEVLKRFDKTGLLRIYGPTVFQGVKVWAGYDSYIKEVPFDGISMIHEISKAGIALVLSSQAHKESELMSNRLFESIAAGALVICDENPFAKNFFGESLLYIDSRCSVEQIFLDITCHLQWVQSYPDLALEKIAKAQGIFRDRFTLIRNLGDLYGGLSQRKQQLRDCQNPSSAPWIQVRLNLLMPQYSAKVLRAHLESVCVQEYPYFSPVLVVDSLDFVKYRSEIMAALASSKVAIELVEIDFVKSGIRPDIRLRTRLGAIIQNLLKTNTSADAFMVVAPNETLFSNHLAVLCGALQRDPGVNCAATAAVLIDGDTPVHAVHELIDFGHVNHSGPCGYGRFIFRLAAIPRDIDIALPYLDGRPLAALVGNSAIDQQMSASITINVQIDFPERTYNDEAETEIIFHYAPGACKILVGFGPRLQTAHTGSVAAAKLKLVSNFFKRRWVRAQIEALRKQGFKARIQVAKRKLAL